jgi:hypothetical protein
MTAKELHFRNDAREKLLRGAQQLADAVRVTLGPRSKAVLIEKKVERRVTSVELNSDRKPPLQLKHQEDSVSASPRAHHHAPADPIDVPDVSPERHSALRPLLQTTTRARPMASATPGSRDAARRRGLSSG